MKNFRLVFLVLALLCCVQFAGAVVYDVHSNAVNIGRGWLSDEQYYWNQSSNEFNVFTVTPQDQQTASGDVNEVALFCPNAYITNGTGLITIARAINTSYEIHDACVAADNMLWVATDQGLYRSMSRWETGNHWLNDTDYFTTITTGDLRRLRFDSLNVYYVDIISDLDKKIYAVDYNTFSAALVALGPVETEQFSPFCDMYVWDDDIYHLYAGSPTYGAIKILKNDNYLFGDDPVRNTVGGSLHISPNGVLYVATSNRNLGGLIQKKYNMSGSEIGTWSTSGYGYHEGCHVFGQYNLQGLHAYNTGLDGSGDWHIETFLTEFNQPLYYEGQFDEDINITGIIYSPHSQYYLNQEIKVDYRIAYHYNAWFVSAVGGSETQMNTDARATLTSAYDFDVDLTYNDTYVGSYSCPVGHTDWSGENYNETCGWGGVFDCENQIDLIQRGHLVFPPPGGQWSGSGSYTATLLITNKSTLEQFILATDSFTMLNETGNETSGYVPIEDEIPDGAGDPESITNNILYFFTLPAFWGVIIYISFIMGLVKTNVNSTAFAITAFLLFNLFCVVGLFAPYTTYLLIIGWIGTGMFFMMGRKMIGSVGE